VYPRGHHITPFSFFSFSLFLFFICTSAEATRSGTVPERFRWSGPGTVPEGKASAERSICRSAFLLLQIFTDPDFYRSRFFRFRFYSLQIHRSGFGFPTGRLYCRSLLQIATADRSTADSQRPMTPPFLWPKTIPPLETESVSPCRSAVEICSRALQIAEVQKQF
jgi:hypothetical protein